MCSTSPEILVERLRQIHEWEQSHLPTYGTPAGYRLFLELASIPIDDCRTLKQVYLSMPCAQSTTRLLFRKLEEDGWVLLSRTRDDRRLRAFERTEKFRALVFQWLGFVALMLEDALIEPPQAPGEARPG